MINIDMLYQEQLQIFAGSCSELAVCTAYVDCKNPVIEKFTVEKKSSALDKILNVLSFGVYSNDDLILRYQLVMIFMTVVLIM